MKKLYFLLSFVPVVVHAMELTEGPLQPNNSGGFREEFLMSALNLCVVMHIDIQKPELMSDDEWFKSLRKSADQLPFVPEAKTTVSFCLSKCDSEQLLTCSRTATGFSGVYAAKVKSIKERAALCGLIGHKKEPLAFTFIAGKDDLAYQQANDVYRMALAKIKKTRRSSQVE